MQIGRSNDRTHLIKTTHNWQKYLSYLVLTLLVVSVIFPLNSTAGVRLDIKSFPLNEKLAKKGLDAPLNPLIPNIDGMRIEWERYKRYDTATFRVHKQKLSGEGRYWKLKYGFHAGASVNTLEVLSAYSAALEQRAATVMMERNGQSFLFELTTAGHRYVGKFTAYGNSVSLEMLEAEAFTQTLKINPDELRAELLNSGKVTLEGVYFDFDKATLQPRSDKAIQAAVVLLRKYPDLELEVQGHTDSKGNEDYNQKLSQRRAASVAKAIVARGIERKRLTSKGYGPTLPIASNDDEAGRAKNRRVELHRTRGGESRAVIGINFIQPIPGSVEKDHRRYEHRETTIFYREPYAKKRSQMKIVGSVERIDWQFKKNGKVDRSVSPKEIAKNYLSVLELFGAKITSVYQNSIDFYLADRGDGREAYGKIQAYTGAYTISFILPASGSVNTPSVNTPKITSAPSASKMPQVRKSPKVAPKQNTHKVAAKPQKAVMLFGKWYFDEAATRAKAAANTDIREYSGLVAEFVPDGTLKYFGATAGQWKFENGSIFVMQDEQRWEKAPMELIHGRLVMRKGNLQLLFSRQAPTKKVETASTQPRHAANSSPQHPWSVATVLDHLSKIEKLQYLFENKHHIQDTRTWHLKREGKQLLSRLYSKNQNGGEFVDSDWVYFNAKAGDAANGPLISNGSRSRKPIQFEKSPKISVPAGTFDCTKVYTRDRYGSPVEAWLINSMPGVPAKIVTKDASYQLERIYP